MRSRLTHTLLISIVAVGLLAPLAAEERPRRDLLQVKFKLINDKGYPIVVVTNMTGRDIDTVRGSIVVERPDGEYVAGTGQTNAVPGQVFLAAGKSLELAPYGFNRKPELMTTLRTNPESLRFFFEVREITYMESTGE